MLQALINSKEESSLVTVKEQIDKMHQAQIKILAKEASIKPYSEVEIMAEDIR